MAAQATESNPLAVSSALDWGRADWRNLGLILAAYLIVMWLMPIDHHFAFIDDWSWYRSTEQIVNGAGFRPPDFSCATLVSHVYWGAGFAYLFGLSFTVLTAANMVMSLIGVLAFYLLLRRLGYRANLSGLGAATLALNPLYVTYSYSYMTDITFVALLLVGCLCYCIGLGRSGAVGGEGVIDHTSTASASNLKPQTSNLKPRSDLWLWLGSGCSALAFLDRQFGLALPLAALIWLGYNRRLNWRNLLATLLIPLLVFGSYTLWRSGFPLTFGDRYCTAGGLQGWLSNFDLELTGRSMRLLADLPLLGLTIPLFSRVARWWVGIFWLVVLAYVTYQFYPALRGASVPSSIPPADYAPPELDSSPIWWLGALLVAWLLAGLSERLAIWLHTFLPRRQRELKDFIYLTATILLLGTFAVNQVIYVRYLLPLLPFLIIALLPPLQEWSGRELALCGLLVGLVGTYAVADHLDTYDYYTVHWQADEDVIAQGVNYDKLDGGFAWNGYHLYEESLRRVDVSTLGLGEFAPNRLIDREYTLSPTPLRGYHLVRQYPYYSRLTGFTTRYILVLQRDAP